MMIANLIDRLLTKCFKRTDIGRGDGDGEYMTRWQVLGRREGRWRVYVHRFHRSDADVPHDHPWPFTSLILWPGYIEQTPKGEKRYGPLSVIRRPAEWIHRVILFPGRGCWTIVISGQRVREWGFHCPSGWRHWKAFDRAMRNAGSGCE